ncbi:MAG: hypothetical protein AAF720_05685 [Pseudomonadota bacterium]
MHRALVSVFMGFVAFAAGSTALAKDEMKCAEQYSFDEQVILEWAAMGGDPHAQFALAQCAFPKGVKKFTEAETLYALKWVTFAACDVDQSAATAHRDRVTRRLKAQGDLSYRRFSGVENDEKFTRREKRFQMYREQKTNELASRLKRLSKRTDDAQRARARYEVGEQMTRMGPIGALRLATLSECEHFGASDSFKAAAWTIAASIWEDTRSTDLYGDFDSEETALTAVASRKRSVLKGKDWKEFDFEKKRFMRHSSQQLAALEKDAALARLDKLKGLVGPARVELADTSEGQEGASGLVDNGVKKLLKMASLGKPSEAASTPIEPATFDGPAVTMATQYALEALGFMEFINGPDNDYGPSTIEAVGKAQKALGHEPTRWLTHGEARDMVCRAAVDAEDPVSYYHVGVMFQNGWGYGENLAKARFAMANADRVMSDKLSRKSDLEAWKMSVYPEFHTQIKTALAEIEDTWESLPEYDRARLANWTPKQGLCQ